MRERNYNREAAAAYAEKWALGRNPAYYDFEAIGGDCTNFASQCLYAGSQVMNHTKTLGWYYYSASNRAPAWTGVQFLYRFLVTNKSSGPYAEETEQSRAEIGDIVQLGRNDGVFYHSPVIVDIADGEIYVAAHSFDAYRRPLSTYVFDRARFLHVLGVRYS